MDTQARETPPRETQPTETPPTETQPTETQPTETQPTETQPTETQATEKKHIFDDPKNVRLLIGIFFFFCAVLMGLDLTDRQPSFHEGEFPVEGWFSFYPIYGFVACVLLVLIAKEMRKVLMRSEDYYSEDCYSEDYYDGDSQSGDGDFGQGDGE